MNTHTFITVSYTHLDVYKRQLPSAVAEVVLTARETDVLRLIAKGLTVVEAADLLGLSRHTVAGYLKDIYRKLAITSRAEATLEAARLGLVPRM